MKYGGVQLNATEGCSVRANRHVKGKARILITLKCT